jgi:CheY-like chemotaxis protein
MTVTVLVVDDEEDVRLALRVMLQAQGWRAEEASNGEEALERCRRGGVDILVLDHKMPGLTGIEVARMLREDGYRAPIILYSAYLTPELEAEADSLGLWAIGKEHVEELMDTLRDFAGNGHRKRAPR